MLLKGLIRIAVLCGLIFAPVAMTPVYAHQAGAAHSSIANSGHSTHCDADRHEPAKSARCSGNCAAIEVDMAVLSVPFLSRLALAPAANMSSLPRIVLDFDTPPPR